MVLYEAYNQKPVMEVKVLLNALSKSSVLCIFRRNECLGHSHCQNLKGIKSVFLQPCIVALVCTVICLTFDLFEAFVKPEHSSEFLYPKEVTLSRVVATIGWTKWLDH